MAIKSVYISEPVVRDNLVSIRDDEHRHLSVARAAVGEEIEIFDGHGNVFTANISAVERRETQARVTGSRQVAADAHELILGQSLIRHAAFEFALEKAVEAGVNRIIPVIAARSNAKDAGRRERWQRIIVEAAKQSKRYHLPVLEEPVSFAKVLDVEAPTKIVFSERNGSTLKGAIKQSPVLYLIGPEGGWTDEELSSAQQQGFVLVGLGSTILKAETAAVVSTALIRYELENLGIKKSLS
jgi:16S rRNA (uracil1498-N3)-methyltransferase